MKIIFLTKRQYMQKDVIDDGYGRLYELPNQLARGGNQIQGICLSYRKREEGNKEHFREDPGSLEWHSFNLGKMVFPGLFQYSFKTAKLIQSFKPDLLLGSSDCPHVIITVLLAKWLKIPCVVDLYDNYESFGLAKFPGMTQAYRWAIQQADGVCCVSEPLADHIRQTFQHSNVSTLESTINPDGFYPMDARKCRQQLQLPLSAKLMGVAGSLHRNRGIDLLYRSFIALADSDPELHLVLAGPVDKSCPIPEHPRIHYLGLLPHDQIVIFYNALDLAVACMRDTDFGRFAFPQKTYEILACRTPLLTARLGALQRTLEEYPQCLYEPEDQNDLQHKIKHLLINPVIINLTIPSWSDQSIRLQSWLQTTIKSKHAELNAT
jgi:teichuronic acid biosynthesis glycosyltransferase TuaC